MDIHCECYSNNTVNIYIYMDGWMKFRKRLPFRTSRVPPLEMKGRVYASCVLSSMTCGSETRPLLANIGLKFERAEIQMIRWMGGVSMKDRRTCEVLRKLVRGNPITTKKDMVRECRSGYGRT